MDKKSVKSRYVMVEEPETPEDKDAVSRTAVSPPGGVVVDWKDVKQGSDMKMMSAVKSAKSRAGVKMKKPVSAVLVGAVASITSGANAINQGVVGLNPVGIQDWSGFAGLYDECRVTKVVAHACVATSAAVAGPLLWGFALDPANGGPYSNLSDVMTARYRKAPMASDTGQNLTAPAAQNATGLYRLEMKLHAGRLTNDSSSGSAASEIGGGWFATASTTAINVGYLKCFVPAGGGTVTTAFSYVVEYMVEFRDRT